MPVRLSRQQLSRYYAKSLLGGADVKKLAMQLAAYLIESGRTKELQMIISDIEYQMSLNGVVIANVTSAHNLDEIAKIALIDFVYKHTDARHVHLKERVDPTVLGGIRLKFIGAELDTTIARRLTTLKANYKR